MEQRKAEIAAKRQRLAEIKKRNAERQLQSTTRRSQDVSEMSAPIPRAYNRESIEILVRDLVGDRPASTGPSTFKGSRPNSVLSAAESNASEITSPIIPSGLGMTPESTTLGFQTISQTPVTIVYDAPPSPIPEILTYSKEVQTTETWTETDNSEDDALLSPEKEEELRERLRREIEEELRLLHLEEADQETMKGDTDKGFFARELTDEEKTAITASEDFLDFIERSSKVVERALDMEYDVLADYGLGVNGEDDDQTGRRLKEVTQFYDERWSKKRMVSDINFSPKFPELVLASYTKNPSAPHDPDGLVQVWNMHLHDRAEYVFHAQSDVLTARFSPFHPNLIVGGAYSGQVLLWDTRAKSQPVLKTPLTGSGHTHPVYSVSVIGTQNANNILSSSTDGVVCGWTVDMLAQPQELLELIAPPPSKTDDLAPTCMAFPHSDPTYFLVGTEEGTIYPCHRYDRAGAKAGIEPRISYRAHAAPVMSVDFHPVRGPVDLGDLVLSSSLDWSVKLWKARPPAATSTTAAGTSTSAQPILEFSREDVVYDARWSPTKPGVFGLVDGAGQLEIWDITVDTEIPIAKATPTPRVGATHLTKSLNKLAWEQHDGKRVAVGGLDGMVTVFDVTLDSPRNEEWASVKRLVSRVEGTAAAAATAAAGTK
ncbi:WD40-repeat-containing domain protein [Tricharina praecox]|uniref:WD40-repeat-containing domain protein n=1 Tax=Tricharina praecox TaxID=43433 RepID=UPI002220D4FB|nr:WD40-repeat-containing domain protein [Tricharina praecox]KAI5849033.1 WD40-repeat-containing domain protein [Tricharina praecox]